jgi:hypothetical protein
MPANVTIIPGAKQVDLYMGNYTYADIVASMEPLKLHLATDINRLIYKIADGTAFKILTDASGAANTPATRLFFADSIGAASSSADLIFASNCLINGSIAPTAAARFYALEAITAHAHYAFLDDSTINNSGAIATLGHASYNCNIKLQGTNNFDHHAAFQNYSKYDGSGTIGVLRGFHSIPSQSAGTISNVMHFQADDIQQTGGTSAAQDGFYIDALSKATANCGIRIGGIPDTATNYGIKCSALAQSYIKGKLGLNIDAPACLLHVRGEARFGRASDDDRYFSIFGANGNFSLYYTTVKQIQLAYTGGDMWLGAGSGTVGADAQLFLQGSTGNLGLGRNPTSGYRLDIAAASGLAMIASTTTTSLAHLCIKNNGTGLFIGKERSTGGGIVTGSIGYSTVIRDSDGKPIHLCVGNVLGATLDASNNFGVGTIAPDRRFHVKVEDAVTSAITYVARFSHYCSAAPVSGSFGVGIEFEAEQDGCPSAPFIGTLSYVGGGFSISDRLFSVNGFSVGNTQTAPKLTITYAADHSAITSGGHLDLVAAPGKNFTHELPDNSGEGGIYTVKMSDSQSYALIGDGLSSHTRVGKNGSMTFTGDATLCVPTKNTTGDPTGAEGMIYTNTFDNKVKVYSDGAWRELATW